MRSTILFLAIMVGMAGANVRAESGSNDQDQDRGAVRLNEPYKWELKSVPYMQAGGLLKTEAATWSGIGPTPMQSQQAGYGNVSGRITCLAVDPSDSNTVYAGAADGGLWKSTDGGTSWTPLTDYFPRLSSGAVAVDPNNPSVVYYGTGELNFNIDGYPGAGVFKSTDGGQTWSQISMQTLPLYYTSAISVAPTNSSVVYASGYYDAYRSTDAGATWSPLNLTNGAVDAIVADPLNANVVYASYGAGFSFDSTNYGIFKSTDGGNTWTKLTSGLPPSNQVERVSLAIAPSNDQVLYAGINGANPNDPSTDTNRVYVSIDAGASWKVLPSVKTNEDFGGNQGWYNNVVAVDPNNPNTVYLGGIDFWKSSDGGQTWTNLTNGYGTLNGKNIHVDQHAIAFAKGSSSTLYMGNDGGVWRSNDGASSFTDCNAGLQTIQFYDIATDPNNPAYTIGGTQDNGTDANSQPSKTWNEVYYGDGGYVMVDPNSSQNIYTEYVNGGLMKSTDGGSTFRSITTGIGEKGYWLEPYVIDPGNSNILYTGTSKIYESTNGGSNWSAITSNLKSSSDLFTTMSISPVENNVLYAGMSGYRGAADTAYLFVSTNSGSSWTDVTSNLPSGSNFGRVTADPTQKGTAYLAVLVGGTSHVLKTTDYGATWTGIASTAGGFPDVPTKVIAIDSTNGYIYAGTYEGVYRSTDGGSTWSQYGTGLPNSVVDAISIQYFSDIVRVGTHGRGVWQINLVTGIATPASQPHSFELQQNYPNPFNPTTLISYEIANSGHVSLRVYNILGQEVASLIDRTEAPGKYSVAFDGKGMASGVYFYTLRSGATTLTRKMILLK